jgi:hypothetical protein
MTASRGRRARSETDPRHVTRNGVLMDVHPEPEHPRVEVVRRERAVAVGSIDWTEDNRQIRAARRRLSAVQRQGFFRLERRRMFDLRAYHDSVDAWLEYRRDRGATSPIASGTLLAARRALRSGGGSVVVIERIRASALRRLDGHDTL